MPDALLARLGAQASLGIPLFTFVLGRGRQGGRPGRSVFLGIATNDPSLPWIEMVRNEQAVFTSFAYAPRDFDAAVRLVESRRFDLSPWTEARPLEQGQDAFLKMAHRRGPTLKMMLEVRSTR